MSNNNAKHVRFSNCFIAERLTLNDIAIAKRSALFTFRLVAHNPVIYTIRIAPFPITANFTNVIRIQIDSGKSCVLVEF